MSMKDDNDKPEALRRNRSRNRNGNGNSSPLSGATTIKTGHHHTHTVANGEKNSSRSKEASMERGKLSRDRKPTRELHEYDTPFDKSGRCHYHVNVQLATKKFNGGWHILFQVCPKCMEQKPTTTKIVRKDSSRNGSSTHFTRSSSRGMGGGGGGGGGGGDAHGQFDSNGCCILHSHVQVATKKILGGGWKVTGMCHICNGESATSLLDDDAHSTKSGKSNRSSTSRKSARSMKTTTTTTAPTRRETNGKATESGRYGTLPFDSDGYCCHHPSVQIAQRKILGGGFKIIHDVCPDCAREGTIRSGGNSSGNTHRSSSRGRDTRSRSKSRNGIRTSRSLSQQQQRCRSHNGCSPPRQQDQGAKSKRRGSVASDVASFKHKLYSEFRM